MGIHERKHRDRKRRQQQIMVAARRVFVERGYHKATMEEIAKEAELSPGTLYLYFKNKNELYASLTLRILQFLKIRLTHVSEAVATEENHPPQAIITMIKDVLLDVHEFDPFTLLSMFYLQSGELHSHLSEELVSEIRQLTQDALIMINDLLAQAIDGAPGAQITASNLMGIVWALFSGIVIWQESAKFLALPCDPIKYNLEVAFELMGRGMVS
jgi:AcrR family transcriptional regulator